MLVLEAGKTEFSEDWIADWEEVLLSKGTTEVE